MNSKSHLMNWSKAFSFTSMSLIAGLALLSPASAQDKKEEAVESAPTSQEQFNSPKEAAEKLIAAAASYDVPALKQILGSDAEDLVSSGDPVMDKNRAEAFAEKAKERHVIEKDPDDPNRAILSVGKDDFPVPIPIDKQHGKWAFNTKVGKQEIINRRVGENELDAIEVCRGFVDAQDEYASEKHDGATINQYAQKIISTPGKQDGLAWKNEDGSWDGPIGETIAKAIEEGYSKQGQPYHGYYFKVLKGQGPAAPMGEMDFMVNGAMIGGFALAAAPAEYRVTGVQTFIVGPSGVVYQKDLGPDTLKAFQEMDRYNPDESWQATDDEWQE